MPKKQETQATRDYSERRWMSPNRRAKGYAEERKNKVHMFGDKQGETLDDYNNIIEKLSNKEIMEQLVTKLLELQDSYVKANSALNKLVKEQRQTENSIKNIMTAIENGGTSNTAMKRLRELETLSEELERNIRIEKAKSAFKLSKQEITEYYKIALEQEPQMLINYLVKEIILFDDKMTIIYNTPKTMNLDNSQGFSFYTENVPYPIYIQNVKQPRMIDFELEMQV